ncbi:MAG: CHASE domain-containing protein [Magnetovibrio sp.]|nr:CHASE domain-containing protein [Magnetovibrio sp.]
MIAAAVGAALSVAAFVDVKTSNQMASDAVFESDSRNRFHAVADALDDHLGRLQALGTYFDVSYGTTRAQFEQFATRLIEGADGIQALEWVPRVPAARRKSLEEVARFSGVRGFTFTERGPDGAMVPVRERAEYYPVYFLQPVPGNVKALGFDLASNPVRKQALEKARDSGEMVFSGRVSLVQDARDQFGILAFRPVYRRDRPSDTPASRRAAIRGFVLAVFRIGDLVERSFAEPLEQARVAMVLRDMTAPEAERLLFPADRDMADASMALGGGKMVAFDHHVGARTWRVIFSPMPGHALLKTDWNAWTVLIAGLVMTGLLTLVIATLLNREQFAAHMVDVRTRELDANQAQMKKYVEKLEVSQEALRKRTWEMSKLADDFRDQKNLAESSEKSKSEFLASMSHEIRTPMAGVLGLADVLLESDLDNAQRDTVRKIKSAGQSLLTILNDILDLSKLEVGKLQIEAIDFQIGEVINDAIDLVRNRAEEKGLYLSVDILKSLPQAVCGDPTRIRQVLINLVGNAVKFTHEGGVSVRVRHQVLGEGKYLLRFEVEDTGIGISEEIQGSLFDDFTQGDTSTSRRYEGTGLGLAISRRLTTLMSGEIGVDSEEGRGSIFWFTAVVEAATTRARGRDRSLDVDSVSVTRPLRILVAEDNELNQMILNSVLEPLGHDITIVSSGMEAVETVKSGGFDIILMDVRMPELDGPEATQAIRRLPGEVADIPIVAVTADVMEENVRGYAAAGMNATVFKPIDRRRLLSTINDVLGEEIHVAVVGDERRSDRDAPASRAADDVPPSEEVREFIADLEDIAEGGGS